jgi:hypothetical protein
LSEADGWSRNGWLTKAMMHSAMCWSKRNNGIKSINIPQRRGR